MMKQSNNPGLAAFSGKSGYVRRSAKFQRETKESGKDDVEFPDIGCRGIFVLSRQLLKAIISPPATGKITVYKQSSWEEFSFVSYMQMLKNCLENFWNSFYLGSVTAVQ